MGYILLKAFSLVAVLAAGIILRRLNMVSEEAGEVVKTLMFFVTLPAAIISNFQKVDHISLAMLVLPLLALAMCILSAAFSLVYTKKWAREERVLHYFSMPAYNIGSFGIPFLQSFFPAMGVVYACVFDVGNCFVCCGGSYAFAEGYFRQGDDGKRFGIKDFLSRLLAVPSPLLYTIMLVITVIGIHLPEQVTVFLQPCANANAFMSMLMLGLFFRIEFTAEYLLKIARFLLMRYLLSAVLAAAVWFLLPMEDLMRMTVTILAFTPISAISAAYTRMCGGDEGVASCINSASIVCSIVIMTALIGVFQGMGLL